MKARLLFVVLVAIFCLFASMPAFAIQTVAKVVSVDTTVGCPRVVVKDETGATLDLTITDLTDIQQGTKDICLTQLKPGSTVVVRYRIKGGKNIAKYIGYVSGNLQRVTKQCKIK